MQPALMWNARICMLDTAIWRTRQAQNVVGGLFQQYYKRIAVPTDFTNRVECFFNIQVRYRKSD